MVSRIPASIRLIPLKQSRGAVCQFCRAAGRRRVATIRLTIEANQGTSVRKERADVCGPCADLVRTAHPKNGIQLTLSI